MAGIGDTAFGDGSAGRIHRDPGKVDLLKGVVPLDVVVKSVAAVFLPGSNADVAAVKVMEFVVGIGNDAGFAEGPHLGAGMNVHLA